MLFSALCLLAGVIRSVPVVIPIRLIAPSARAGVRGGVWSVVVSLVGDLLVFLGGRRGAGVRFVSLPWDGEKKIGGGFSCHVPLLACSFVF